VRAPCPPLRPLGAARRRAPTVALLLVGGVALAAPDGQRFDGARCSFTVPAGSKVTEGTDVVAEHAYDVEVPGLPGRAHVLFGDGKATDGELESLAAAWRDKRLRNRASWGVHASGDHRVRSVQVNGRRGVELTDDLTTTFGGRQVMICYPTSGHLACASASGPPEQEHSLEELLTRMLASLRLR